MAVKFGPREYGARTTYSASGNINEDLSVPYTITRLAVFVDVDITTTSQTLFNDYWDRIITSLSLATPTRTFFNFTSMRAGMHSQRFRLGPLAPRRPDPAGNDLTAQPFRFVYLFHFGVARAGFRPARPTSSRSPACLVRRPRQAPTPRSMRQPVSATTRGAFRQHRATGMRTTCLRRTPSGP